jgi:predicted dehydrogenase
MNEAEARSMLRTASETGKTLGVAYYRRSYPKVRRAQQLLDAGAIGRPVFAELTCHDWFDGRDRSRAWLVDPARAGGGPLFDIGAHRIDLLNFLFGQPQREWGARGGRCTVALESEAGRMPHTRHGRRNGFNAFERAGAGLSRRQRASSAVS